MTYFKVQKVNREKFEDEGPAIIVQSLEAAREAAKGFTNEKYGYSITKVIEVCKEFEV